MKDIQRTLLVVLKMATSIDVSVETVAENKILEVTLDGQEIYDQPLSMSENLTKLAQKIDFSKDESEEKGKPTSEVEKEIEEEKPLVPFQPSLWPWDSVRTKLKAALQETSVLLDVLNIAKEKRYMVLDPVSQDPPESKVGAHIAAKKKGLSSAASVLLAGAERMKKTQVEISQMNRTHPEFHLELMALRQTWRLKKVGNTILGDLGYRSAGSRFWQGATFEVKKSESPGEGGIEQLETIIPSDLEGAAFIQVTIRKIPENTTIGSADLEMPGGGGRLPPTAHWQRKLEAAQNVIFCKELFAQLAKEASFLKPAVPHMVIGNQIYSNLFSDVQLIISLRHYTGKDKRQMLSPTVQQKPDQNPVLEHSLHQLLREMHYKNIHHPMPHPVTAMLGMSKRRRLAGPQAADRKSLLEMTESETLLEQIIQQSRHIVLRQRVLVTVDSIALSVPDPQLAAHWNSITSPSATSMKIKIASLGYEQIRALVALHIGTDSIQAVCRDGRVILLSHEMEELKDFLLTQISQHHITNIQNLAKMMNWQVLSVNTHIGVGDMEPVTNASSIMIASPSGDRVLSIRSGPISGLKVSLQTLPRPAEDNNKNGSSVTRDPKWLNVGGAFKEVKLEKIDGKTIMNKIESLMACCSRV